MYKGGVTCGLHENFSHDIEHYLQTEAAQYAGKKPVHRQKMQIHLNETIDDD